MPPDDLSSENVSNDNPSDLMNGGELKVSNSTAKREFVKFVCNLSSVRVNSADSGVWTRWGNIDPIPFLPCILN